MNGMPGAEPIIAGGRFLKLPPGELDHVALN